ncbi:Protein BATH-24 [Aphelenchoides avenae]|nr:Protein BATH-24 [Aphelenchus avenae]
MKRPDETDLLSDTADFVFDAQHREVLFAPFTNVDFLNDNRAAFARKGGVFDLEIKLKIRQVNFDLYPGQDFTSGGDVVLNVDGRKFYVDKKYLAVHSPYFEALFHGEFAEQNKDEVKLSKVNPEHFMQFLQVIYPSSKEVTADNVMGLVELADQFNAKGVLAKCQEFLCSKESDKHFSLYDKLKVADQRDLKQVKTYVMKRIRTQAEFYRISKKSAGMSQSTLEMLLRKNAALGRNHGRLLDSDEEAASKKGGHLSDESSW